MPKPSLFSKNLGRLLQTAVAAFLLDLEIGGPVARSESAKMLELLQTEMTNAVSASRVAGDWTGVIPTRNSSELPPASHQRACRSDPLGRLLGGGPDVRQDEVRAISQRARKRMEELFGCMKTVGGFASSGSKESAGRKLEGYRVGAVYNLLRWSRRLTVPPKREQPV